LKWTRIFQRARCIWKEGWSARCSRWDALKCCRAAISRAKPGSPSCASIRARCSTATATCSAADANLFFAVKPRGFSRSFPEVIKFGAPHAAAGDHFDFVDARGVDRKNALHADAVGNLAHGEHGAATAARDADHDALEDLGALFLAFDDFDVDSHGLAGPKSRRFLLDLLGFQSADSIHNCLLFI